MRLFGVIKRTVKNIVISVITIVYDLFPLVNALECDNKRQEKIIVSLTSYPKRLRKVHITIKSLMLQTMKPDRIILYLGDDSASFSIPRKLERLKKSGLLIEYKAGNLKSHKKYVYALNDYPNDIIILVDDDLIYEPKMIERLYASYKRYPTAISAKRVHRMTMNPDGSIAAYNHWEYECKSILVPSMELFPTTGGGTLVPPHCLPKMTTDSKLFMEHCDNADDVWLKFMQVLAGTPAVFVNGRDYIEIPEENVSSLSSSNVDKELNDYFVHDLESLFDVSLGSLCTEVYEEKKQYRRLKQ